MRAVAIIPARYASTRLPGKPILEVARQVTGKYIIQHVYENVSRATGVGLIVVATDDERIAEAVRAFGGQVRMTRPDHQSGTDRVAEVAAGLDADIVVNVQGDEPEIRPEQVDQVVGLLEEDRSAVMATLACPIRSAEEWRDPGVVKAVLDRQGNALYFSRSSIPFYRGCWGLPADPPVRALHHLGIYAYRREFLLGYARLPASALEAAEKLEQLRALSAGYRIKVGITPFCPIGIDTPQDLEAWLGRHRRAPEA